MWCRRFPLAIALAALAATTARAQGVSDEEIATKLANPVSSLVSVPFQMNWDRNIGPARDGRKFYLTAQPVVPFALTADWMVISRTIVPIVDQHVPMLGDGSQSGIGDVTQSLFFSPAKPRADGIFWGAGPVIVIPSDADFISAKKWSLGPTAVVVRQQHGWTYGLLANHVWSIGGSGAQDVSNTFVQPVVNYTTKNAWTFAVNTESTYDWKRSQWTVPVNATVSKLVRIGRLPVNIGVGARYYVESANTGPHGWGARLVVTLVFPK